MIKTFIHHICKQASTLFAASLLAFSATGASALERNEHSNIFCWDTPSGSTEFQLWIEPTEFVEMKRAYRFDEIPVYIKVGELAHRAKQMSLSNLKKYGWVSERFKRSEEMVNSSVIAMVWTYTVNSDILILYTFDLDVVATEGEKAAYTAFRDGKYSRININQKNLEFTRYKKVGEEEIKVANGFCEDRS